MKIRIYIFFMLIFGQSFSLYSCEESKSGDEPEIVDLTSVSEAAKVFRPVLSIKPYLCVSHWKEVVSADGTRKIFKYRVIDEDSSEFKGREREVEEFAAQTRDNDAKLKYYVNATCFGGMSPLSTEHSESLIATYCLIHHCYQHECLRLYAGQAYALQPSFFLKASGMKLKKNGIDEAVAEQGRKDVLKKMAPKYEINILNKLRKRQLGLC